MSMKRILLCILILLCCISYVNGAEAEATDPDELLQELPEEAAELLQGTAPEKEGFVHTVMMLVFRALGQATDSIRQGLKASGTLLAIVLL